MGYRALVEYDGTAYEGFQRQRRGSTIQGQLELAIQAVARQAVNVTGAGRTDSGVHATGQVIAFEATWRHSCQALERALNASLPQDIAVRGLEEAEAGFHPRFSARRRLYEYTIYTSPVRRPLQRLRAWHVPRPLAVAPMNQAAEAIIGRHDFATFGQPPQGENTEREVFVARWRQVEEVLTFEIEANAFLYRMVRSLVGSMKMVGEGRWTVTDFLAALAKRDRSQAAQTAPPHGLCLTAVRY
jgi:tRNA pseudouridine38-40 synthase